MKKTHLRNITNPQFDILFSAILSKKLNFKNFAKKKSDRRFSFNASSIIWWQFFVLLFMVW